MAKTQNLKNNIVAINPDLKLVSSRCRIVCHDEFEGLNDLEDLDEVKLLRHPTGEPLIG